MERGQHNTDVQLQTAGHPFLNSVMILPLVALCTALLARQAVRRDILAVVLPSLARRRALGALRLVARLWTALLLRRTLATL